MQKEIKKIKAIKRRKFFSSLGKSVAGLFALNIISPLKMFMGRDTNTAQREQDVVKTIKVTEHPLAVKRNKRG